jgi:predicted enzyme related to lactoylglutathione lyase
MTAQPPIGSLNRIIIYSGDAIRCATFCRDYFGLPPIGKWSSEWAELDGGRCRLAFHQAYGPDGPITAPTGSVWNPHKIAFTVSDVNAARERLVSGGISLGEIQAYEDADNLIAFQGTDPEGHVFQVCNK